MNKKLILFLVVLSLAALGGAWFLYMHSDRQSPAIVVMKDGFAYHADVTMEELLSDVTAVDSRDGDVTSSLMVEDIVANEDGHSVSVVYTAKDHSNNVGQTTYVMPAEGDLPDVLTVPEMTEDHSEASEEDAAASKKKKKSKKGKSSKKETDQDAARREEEEKIDMLRDESPRVYLKEYYIEVPAGTQLDQLSYVDTIEDDVDDRVTLFTRIQVYSNVNTEVPGNYEMTYYVLDSDGNQSNMATLRVRVM